MINMIKYIKSIINDFLEEIMAVWTSPEMDNLFSMRDKSMAKPLLEEQARAFHRATAQLLFLSTRARQDIQPVTAFLMMRVRCPDKTDWGNLKWLAGYLQGTLNMPLHQKQHHVPYSLAILLNGTF